MKKMLFTGLTALIISLFILIFPCSAAYAASTGYSFNVASKTLYVGWKSYLCDIRGISENAVVTYRSDDENVATVTDEGEIFPVAPGKTVINADITEGKKTYTCSMKVTVKDPYSKVSEQTEAMTLNKSYTFSLKRYGHRTPVSWILEGEGLAEIESSSASSCTLTTVAPGNVVLKAICGDDIFTFNIKIYDGEGELFILSPESETYNGNYIKYGTYNSKTKDFYLLRSYLEALNSLKGGVLVLTKGTYTITNSLCIPSNTTIVLEDGVRIVKSDDTGSTSLVPTSSIFQTVSFTNAAKEGIFSGYNGEHDIKILGEGVAIIDLNNIVCQGIVCAHCKNLTISGIYFMNMNTYHFIELDASYNATIKNNYFFGASESATTRKEAINVDTPDKNTGGFNQYWTSYDKTPNKNIYITDNVFYKVECGIGTHKYSEGSAHKNLNILRNTFIDCQTYAIRCMNWDSPVIRDNSFIYSEFPEYSKISILVNGCTNPLITENRFEKIETPVSFFHWYNSGYGSEYAPIYNTLDKKYADALRYNYVVDVANPNWEYYTILDDFSDESLELNPIDGYQAP